MRWSSRARAGLASAPRKRLGCRRGSVRLIHTCCLKSPVKKGCPNRWGPVRAFQRESGYRRPWPPLLWPPPPPEECPPPPPEECPPPPPPLKEWPAPPPLNEWPPPPPL